MTLIAIGYSYVIMILYKQQKEIMKHSILATAIALVALSSTAQAAYIYKLPLEVAGGGSLPNGTISFGNGGNTSPVEPTEPEPSIPDPFEPENPACDPYAQGYPGNSIGRDTEYGMYYKNSVTGFEYHSCKLKSKPDGKLLARIGYYIPSELDYCNSSQMVIKREFLKMACAVQSNFLNYYYQVSKDASGSNSYSFHTVQVNLNGWPVPLSNVDRIVVDGSVCNNLRMYALPTGTLTNIMLCDTALTYPELAAKMDKQIMLEIYGK